MILRMSGVPTVLWPLLRLGSLLLRGLLTMGAGSVRVCSTSGVKGRCGRTVPDSLEGGLAMMASPLLILVTLCYLSGSTSLPNGNRVPSGWSIRA